MGIKTFAACLVGTCLVMAWAIVTQASFLATLGTSFAFGAILGILDLDNRAEPKP